MQAESTLEQAWASPERSQDELISEFQRLTVLVKELEDERKDIRMQLAGIAFANKGAQDTVHLQGTGGQKLKVVFGTENEYITEELMEVSKILGSSLFDSLFTTKISFTAKKRELKQFLNTVSSSERVETAKKMIKDATLIKQKAPYVSVE